MNKCNNNVTDSGTSAARYVFLFALCFLLFGFFSAILVGDPISYSELDSPPLSPPPQLFAIVWSVLYIIVGGVTGAVFANNIKELNEERRFGLTLSFLGFILNLLWYPLFFGRGELTAALVDVAVILIFNIVCTVGFYKIKKAYGLLLVPYSLWLAFAFYLNLGYIILN